MLVKNNQETLCHKLLVARETSPPLIWWKKSNGVIIDEVHWVNGDMPSFMFNRLVPAASHSFLRILFNSKLISLEVQHSVPTPMQSFQFIAPRWCNVSHNTCSRLFFQSRIGFVLMLKRKRPFQKRSREWLSCSILLLCKSEVHLVFQIGWEMEVDAAPLKSDL